MIFIPEGHRAFGALCDEMEGHDGTSRDYGAVWKGKASGVRWGTPWIGWWRPIKRRNSCRWIELRQTVEGLVRISVGSPIGTNSAEVMIQRAVLLGHVDDVIDGPGIHGRRDSFIAFYRDCARVGATAGFSPGCKIGVRARS